MSTDAHRAKVPLTSEPDWITRTEAAAILRVTPSTLDRYAREGKVRRYLTPGRRPRYDRAEVHALIESWAS
jgi:excisionase family DNA binding protein